MKLKDLNVKQVIVLKYFACKFVMEVFNPDNAIDKLISEMAKDRLAEKHNIANAYSKNIDEVVFEITKDRTKEERESLVSTTYDYVVNKLFTIENSDAEDPFNDFPESLVIYSKNQLINDKLVMTFNTSTMYVMTQEYYKQMNTDGHIKTQKSLFAAATGTTDEYAIIISE